MKLYGYRNGRTFRALWALEEIGEHYDYVEVDLFHGEARQPWFLKLNPAGKVPVLDDGGTIITESAAICIHLAEKHPEKALLPSAGTSGRSACFQWISFLLTEVDAPLWTIAKHRFALPKERRVAQVIATASWEFTEAAKILANRLEADCPYLVESGFTVADIVAAHTLQWAKSARLPLGSELLERYLQRLLSREAAVRARAIVKETV